MSKEERRTVRVTVSEKIGPFYKLSVNFDADVYDRQMFDTRVNCTLENFFIAWDEKENFTKELAELLIKYQI